MDDIAERAGVSKPVLYQHFPGKFELYLALLDEGAERLVDTVRDALDSTTDNKQRVHATIAAYYDFVGDNNGAFRLVFESDLTSQEQVRARVDSANRRCADLVTKVIAEDAGLSPHESHLLAVGLIGLAQVSARSWLGRRRPGRREAATTAVRAACLTRSGRVARHRRGSRQAYAEAGDSRSPRLGCEDRTARGDEQHDGGRRGGQDRRQGRAARAGASRPSTAPTRSPPR